MSSIRRSVLWQATTLTALALALTACASDPDTSPATDGEPVGQNGEEDWDAVVAAAEDEGTVVLYTTMAEHLLGNLTTAFEAKYDIRVEVFRGQTHDMIERLENEIASGSWQADLVNYSDALHVQEMVAGGYVDTDPDIPSSEGWPEQFFTDGMGQMQLVVGTICYNTDNVSPDEAPQDWDDLVDPQWQGRIAVLDPGSNLHSGTPFHFLADRYGDEFLQELGQHGISWWGSAAPMVQAVAAGEQDIGVVCTMHAVEEAKAQGAPVDWVDTPEMSGWGAYIWKADADYVQNPNAARVFLDFVMSEEGQLSYLGGNIGTSALGLDGTLPLPQQFDDTWFTDPETIRDNLDHLRELLGLPQL